MKTLIEFKPNDPFDIGNFPFAKIADLVPVDHYTEFVTLAYKTLLEGLLLSEMRSSYYYPQIGKLFNDSKIEEFFLQMSREEAEHGVIVTDMIDQAYGTGTEFNERNKEDYQNCTLSNYGLPLQVAGAYIQEIKAVSMFSVFYTCSSSDDKRNFISKFLKEEGPHTLHLLSVYNTLVDKLSTEDKLKQVTSLLRLVSHNKFLLQNFFKENFTKDQVIEIYKQNAWHDKFLEKSNKRLYPLVKVLDSSISYDEFVTRTNVIYMVE